MKGDAATKKEMEREKREKEGEGGVEDAYDIDLTIEIDQTLGGMRP